MRCAITLLTMVLVSMVQAEPQWTFDNAETQKKFWVDHGECVAEKNRLIILPSNHDVNLSAGKIAPFKAEERPFFAARYRANTKKNVGGIFFTTDTLTDLSDKSFSSFRIQNDNAWHNVIVDMRAYKHGEWKGLINSFRFDILNPSEPGSIIELSKLGFFASREEAEAFCANADDSIEFTKSLMLSGPTYRALISSSALKPGWKRENFLVQPYEGKAGKLMVCCDGEPVPSKINSRGFAFYRAGKEGRYTIEPATEKQVALSPEDERVLGADVVAPIPAEYFKRERIRIGGWGIFGDSTWLPEKVKDFAACGLDFLIANGKDSNVHRINLLRACNEAGIEVIISDGKATVDPEHAGMDCADQPSFAGHQLRDEPGSDQLPALGRAAKRYYEASGKIPFINLLPMYANAAQLKYGANAAAIKHYDKDPDLFRKYCECFCENVDVPYICTDIYPLVNNKQTWRRVYRDYVESINVIADVARKHNREFWSYILCFGFRNGLVPPSADEIRWQCYSMLSFGCRNILCWIYFNENSRLPALVTLDGKRTPSWYYTREAFQEMHRLSDVYCQYRNLGAFTHNCTEKTPYLKMTNEYKNFTAIRRLECPDPLLIGCFEKKIDENANAFTLVNMSDIAAGRTTLVTLDLGGKGATVYRNGLPIPVVPDADGLVRIPLARCEGVFVTL